jgi:hypothetical protein
VVRHCFSLHYVREIVDQVLVLAYQLGSGRRGVLLEEG